MTTLALAPASVDGRVSRVALLGVGTAAPPALPQAFIAERMMDFACQTPEQRDWLLRVSLRCGIEQRGSVLVSPDRPPTESIREFYPPRMGPDDHGPTTAARMARYALEAPPLAHSAASAALLTAHTPAANVTHLVTASCTGFFAPGLDSALIHSLGLPPTVQRLHIGFMGCHAAFNALAAARSIALADPAAVVLVCCVELCTLHFAYGWDPGKLVANALFADGAAAAVVGRPGSDSPPLHLRAAGSCLLPDSAGAMTWNIGNHGFEMTLSPDIPALVARHLPAVVQRFLAAHDLALADIARFAIHPGGPKVLTAIASALRLPKPALEASRHVLAQHGNMSSATILFILQHLAATTRSGPTLAIGLGPGLMAELMLLE